MARAAFVSIVLLVLGLVPSAVAQEPPLPPPITLTANSPDVGPEGRVTPESEVVTILFTLRFGCETPAGGGEMRITFEGSTVDYATIIPNPAKVNIDQDPADCAVPGFEYVVECLVSLSTYRSAPAFETFNSTITAKLEGARGNYVPAVSSFSLTNDFIPLTQVAPAMYFMKSAPGKDVVFPIQLTNLGNGVVDVTTEISQPNKNKLDAVTPPDRIRLESRTQKGAGALYREDAKIELRTPGQGLYGNTIYSFNAKFVTKSAEKNDTLNDETSVVLSVQVQGSGGAPGLSPLLVAACLAGVVLLRKRRVA